MNADIKSFGQLSDGTEIDEITLNSQGIKVRIMTWGAAIRDLKVTTGSVENRRVVLGLTTIEDYVNHSPHFGAIAGRYANRIAAGQFHLDGDLISLDKNERGYQHLHGGEMGFGKVPWSVVDCGDEHVTLELISPDGDQGYPGELTANCTYRVIGDARLQVELTAKTSAPTIVNLAQHSYFNLDETSDIWDHKLQIHAKTYLPATDKLLPTGEIKSVDGTAYDFRQLRDIHLQSGESSPPYDCNYIVAEHRQPEALKVATLSGVKGLAMDLLTTEPGLQFYDGGGIRVPVPGLTGDIYQPHAGLCLEPQLWPDSPNHPDFPSPVLRPNETYRQVTEYHFKDSAALS